MVAIDTTLSSALNSLSLGYDPDPRKNVYVKNFGYELTETEFAALFAAFGTITSCVIMKDSSGKSRGFGFVAYQTSDQAQTAISSMNGMKIFNGRTIYASVAQKKAERFAVRGQESEQPTRIYVKNLAEGVDEAVLTQFFSIYGTVLSADIARHFSGISKRYGYVTFRNFSEAKDAVSKAWKAKLHGNELFVALDKFHGPQFVLPVVEYPRRIPFFNPAVPPPSYGGIVSPGFLTPQTSPQLVKKTTSFQHRVPMQTHVNLPPHLPYSINPGVANISPQLYQMQQQRDQYGASVFLTPPEKSKSQCAKTARTRRNSN
ncbi:hypothetical protein QR680_002954 [Steinernema hermaphroditum]|uniref:RRM domain-containing protein n=1 Tax=Steinernema hermaphroditum TaxID=289476 RepID=A0AA39H5R5_9BILA|nr:hypothetical protein QR680_002954 [Steinernema hermaphroditum]